MKRTFATLGVVGLGLVTLTAPAIAAPNMVIVCHDGSDTGAGWDPIQFNVNGLNGHDGHASDIIPPNTSIPRGLNWTNAGKIIYIANCAPLPPGETPPIYPPVEPVVVIPPLEPVVVIPPLEPVVVIPPLEPTVVVPPLEPVVVIPPLEPTVVVPPGEVVQAPVTTTVPPTVQAPAAPAATVRPPAVTGAAAVSQGTNQGFNAQTAVGGTGSAPTWLAGLGLLVGAGALVAVRRRSQEQAG
jgi:hypothetical protein